MNAVAKIDRKRNFARWHRRAEAHDPCLVSFRCHARDEAEEISDNLMRWKGFLTYWDAFADPMAGTRYVICTQPKRPNSPATYFYQVGKHMAGVMRDSDDDRGKSE